MSKPFDIVRSFTTGDGSEGRFHSLPALEEQGFDKLSRLPVSIRIVLESLLRNCDGEKITETDIRNLANYNAADPGEFEIPFIVARIVLQDLTGVPLLVDLASMRSVVDRMGKDVGMIEPLVPVDLVVDHSVQVDFAGTSDALSRNLDLEFIRNRERYEFLKWGQQAFDTFSVVPPGIGIVHQVNLEYLASGVLSKDGMYYPDTLVGTDSHTTMINGLGVVAWGVGGIEAEAGMLGQPVTFLVPEVVGVHMTGALREGVTATDLVLHVTQMLREHGVVGKFVEFHGEGARALPLPDRATVANMAPEYGATMGYFPIDEESAAYFKGTGRSDEVVATFEAYYKAQNLWGIPDKGEIDYTDLLELELGNVAPSVSGPKRPQDRIELPDLGKRFTGLMDVSKNDGGFEKTKNTNDNAVTLDSKGGEKDSIKDGSVVIAAITSCTNTSNPSVMLAAGLLAQKANAKGLTVKPAVKTSLGPGSRVVTDYLVKTDLQKELDQLGFETVGYGCTTCIGNSGPLDPSIESVIQDEELVVASVLSGNRNFEARIHQSIRSNFLMSPPLVVAYAIAGTVDIDLTTQALGQDSDGNDVFLKDIWPSLDEVHDAIAKSMSPETFRQMYTDFEALNPKWNEIPGSTGSVYSWNKDSTYVQDPPFFESFSMEPKDIVEIENARPLGIFGDSVTTDHISPAGAIKLDGPAGRYLIENGVEQALFNSFGSRRGNDRVMTRGTFANVRIKNLMCPGTEGGVTQYFSNGSANSEQMDIFDAAEKYKNDSTPLVVIGGDDYGMGSSRDWAAKGTNLLGVKAVVTKSFERIHRSNLVGMGVLPLNFKNVDDYEKVVGLADAKFSILGIDNNTEPFGECTMRVHQADGESFDLPLIMRIDTPVEIDYYRAGGILPYVLQQILRGE